MTLSRYTSSHTFTNEPTRKRTYGSGVPVTELGKCRFSDCESSIEQAPEKPKIAGAFVGTADAQEES